MGFWFVEPNVGFYIAAPNSTPSHDIFYYEALCITCTFYYVQELLLDDSRLVIFTDSHNTVDIFSSLKCLPYFNPILKLCMSICMDHDYEYCVVHVPAENNKVADMISNSWESHQHDPILCLISATHPGGMVT